MRSRPFETISLEVRRRGAREGRVGGGHQGIGWSQSEIIGKRKFTATDGVGTPRTNRSRRGGKGRGEQNRAGPSRGRFGSFGWRELRKVEWRREWWVTWGGVRSHGKH